MLGPRERTVLDTLLPPNAHPSLPGLFEAGFDEFYEDFRREAVAPMRLGFRAALWTAVWVSPTLIGKVPPISRHDRPTRERCLEAMARSRAYPIRQLFLLLKAVACFCYGAAPAVRDALGFPKEPLARRRGDSVRA